MTIVRLPGLPGGKVYEGPWCVICCRKIGGKDRDKVLTKRRVEEIVAAHYGRMHAEEKVDTGDEMALVNRTWSVRK